MTYIRIMLTTVSMYLLELQMATKILLAVLFVALLVFVLVTAYIGYIRYKYRHIPGPPYHSFYLGHLPELIAYRKKKYVSHLFLQWAEEYGPCYKVFIVYRCLIFVNSVEAIKELLTKSKYTKSKQTYQKLHTIFGMRFLGTGILTETDHSKWYPRRLAINPAFHKKYLRMFMQQFNEVGDKWIEALDKVADGSTMFSMHDYLCRVTLDAISEVGFNYKMNALEGGDNRFIKSILYALQGISKTFKDPLMNYRPSEKKFRENVVAAIKFLREEYGRPMLTERVRKMKAEPQEGVGLQEDILAYIIRCKEMYPELEDDDLLDDVMTLFIAGQETTSNVLSFLFLEIGQRPDVVLRLQEEVDSVLEGRTFVTYDDLSKMEYVGQVFKETLRLYPPAPGTSRNLPTDTMLEGHNVPVGSFVVTSFFVAHRLSRNFSEPEEFRPERFNKSEPRPLFKYMPFSVGHRSCIGQQFATIEAKLLICKFIQKFTLTLDPEQSFEIMENATLRPMGGCRMTLTTR